MYGAVLLSYCLFVYARFIIPLDLEIDVTLHAIRKEKWEALLAMEEPKEER